MQKVFVMLIGNTLSSHQTFLDHLTLSPKIRIVDSVGESDAILAFVPVVSRAGTDIEAALKKIPETGSIVLVVLHHTNDPYSHPPDSRRAIRKTNVFAVDCLFNEDRGLLRCVENDEALRAVKQHLEQKRPAVSNPEAISWKSDTESPYEGYGDVPYTSQPCLEKRSSQVILWLLVMVSIILMNTVTTKEFIYFTSYIPWMLLLLAILLERCGRGSWIHLIIIIVNILLLIIFAATKGQEGHDEAGVTQSPHSEGV